MSNIIGKVAIKVSPDTSDFAPDLKRDLEAIEHRLEVTVPVNFDPRQVEKELNRTLKEVGKQAIDVGIDFNQAEALAEAKKINDEIHKEFDDIDTDLEFNVDYVAMTQAQREIEKIQLRIEQLNKRAISPKLSEEARHLALIDVANLSDDLAKKLNNIEMQVVIDQAQADEEQRKLEQQFNDINAEIHPDVNSIAARDVAARLALLGRSRFVTFIPRVSASGARVVATTLAAISGARLSGKLVEDLADMFKNIDKNLPKIAALGTGILGLGAAALSSTANIITFAGSLLQIGLAGLALPGILGGLIIGLTATIIPLLDINKVIPDVVEQWKTLRTTMSDNFWKKAEAPLRRITNKLMPQLTKGFAKASTEIGSFFGKLADGLSKNLDGALVPMFDDLGVSIGIASEHADSMARIITILGRQGANQLPRLAGWFGDITDRFSNFLSMAENNGALADWVDLGVQRLKELGVVVKEAGSILKGLFDAAERGGGSSLKSLGDALGDIARVVNSPDFQKGLVGTLLAADDAMQNIADISGPAFTNLFKKLSDTLQVILPKVGSAIGTLLAGVAEGLSTPALQSGLVDFFSGLEQAFKTLRPVLTDVGGALGGVLSVLGTAIKSFAPLVSTILGTLASMFNALAPSIQKVVVQLSGAFLKVLQALAPVLVSLAKKMAPVLESLGNAFAEALSIAAPYIAEIAKALGGALVGALKALAPYLPEFASKVFPQLAEAVKAIAPNIPALVDGFLGLVDAIVSTPLVENLGKLAGSLIGLVASGVMPVLADTLPGIAGSLSDLAGALNALTSHAGAVTVVRDIALAIQDLSLGIAGLSPETFLQIGYDIVDGIVQGVFASGSTVLVTALESVVRGAVFLLAGGIGGLLLGAGSLLLQGLADGIRAAFPIVSGILSVLTALIPVWKPVATDGQLLFPAGVLIVQGLANGIRSAFGLVQGALQALTQMIRSMFASAGSWLVARGSGLIRGLWSGINSARGTITSVLRSIITGIRSMFAPAGSWLLSAGRNVANGLRRGMDAGRGAVAAARNALKNAARNIGSTSGLLVSAGLNAARGFANGIRRGVGWVISAAWDLARSAYNAAQAALDSHSPSREFFSLGVDTSDGYRLGIESKFGLIKKSVKKLVGDLSKTTSSLDLQTPVVQGSKAGSVSRQVTANAVDPATSGAARSTPNVQINNYNPVAEPASRTLNKAMRQLQLV